jgi:hypothetical protein
LCSIAQASISDQFTPPLSNSLIRSLLSGLLARTEQRTISSSGRILIFHFPFDRPRHGPHYLKVCLGKCGKTCNIWKEDYLLPRSARIARLKQPLVHRPPVKILDTYKTAHREPSHSAAMGASNRA